MKIIVIGSRAYNELVGRIEKIEAAIASLPEKGRAWNKDKDPLFPLHTVFSASVRTCADRGMCHCPYPFSRAK